MRAGTTRRLRPFDRHSNWIGIIPLRKSSLGLLMPRRECTREAIAAYQEAIKLGEDTPRTQTLLGTAFAKAGERAKAQEILKRLQSGNDYVSPTGLAVLQTALGEREQAFASLEKAYTSHDLQLQYLSVDPALDSLRSDPHFAEIVRRVSLPE